MTIRTTYAKTGFWLYLGIYLGRINVRLKKSLCAYYVSDYTWQFYGKKRHETKKNWHKTGKNPFLTIVGHQFDQMGRNRFDSEKIIMVTLCQWLYLIILCEKTTWNEEKPTWNGAKTRFWPYLGIDFDQMGRNRFESEKIIMITLYK